MTGTPINDEAYVCSRCRRAATSLEDYAEWVGDPPVCPHCLTGEDQSRISDWETRDSKEHETWRDREAARSEHLTDEQLEAEYGHTEGDEAS
jgi:hypothetical protein